MAKRKITIMMLKQHWCRVYLIKKNEIEKYTTKIIQTNTNNGDKAYRGLLPTSSLRMQRELQEWQWLRKRHVEWRGRNGGGKRGGKRGRGQASGVGQAEQSRAEQSRSEGVVCPYGCACVFARTYDMDTRM